MYAYSSFILKTTSTICLCIQRNAIFLLWSWAAALYGCLLLFRKAHAVGKKEKRFISVSNKRNCSWYLPGRAESWSYVQFCWTNTTLFFTVCGVGLFAATLNLYLQYVMFICEMVCHLPAIESGLQSYTEIMQRICQHYVKNVVLGIYLRCCAIKVKTFFQISSKNFSFIIVGMSKAAQILVLPWN